MTTAQETPLAKDVMNRHVFTIGTELSLADIVTFLAKHKISNAPVVDKLSGKDVLVGIVSEADCLEHLSNELFYGNPSPAQTAATIMQKHPICVALDTNLFALASILVNHRLRHVPVVDDHVLQGIVSRRDILIAMDKYYRAATKRSKNERFPPDLHEIIHHRFIAKGR
jgi:predicted transcriptional regulator